MQGEILMPLCIVAAAGHGLGIAIARRFTREGFAVALIARDRGKLDALAAPLVAEGAEVSTQAADMCTPAEVATAFAEIAARHGSADVLVYNGARWHEGPAMELDPADFNSDLALCATGALVCAQHVYPAMRDRGAGTMLFTGGGLALQPEYGAGIASLTAGKSALRGLTFALAGELAPQGIHVATVTVAGTVAPGTPFAPDAIADAYWALHTQSRDSWSIETVFTG